MKTASFRRRFFARYRIGIFLRRAPMPFSFSDWRSFFALRRDAATAMAAAVI